MTAEIHVRYSPDDEWLGQLVATVKSGTFSGTSSAWFDRQAVKDGFINTRREFPISAASPPVIQGGFWDRDRKGILEQCHLRIAVRPYNVRGELLVVVDLATESRTNPDRDQQQSVTVRFLTEYGNLDTFAAEFEQVLDGQRERATLLGSKT
ncbi:hypothetical protein SAMN06265338_13110 [Rhodoblastus acidophilus]|uniref:Uncharacterized protein n=1 Tax=Rhodoblastus acidophilus TaxID=1074 RepID=A0A212SEC4_RHOAC|nr:hypothetical protein [Rhodoblastus acidophilus]PPQ34994.1 hypothetical protein CKO16_21290 [Rhodoblastus acidophilus]RAI20011.1 hypothetical protein CH337_10990 [Rhodoblastus acidophilus]SNB83892.1 hypothetical protein SAMN06265338_13110 [Rhodoblastus acidophilus]